MELQLPNARYERKFVAQSYSLEAVLAIVRRHPAMFREIYPPRAVNNLYLDSPSFQSYHEHVNGAANRAKTRIRWYGALDGFIESPALERKIKHGEVGGKISYRLPPIHDPRSTMHDSSLHTIHDSPLESALAEAGLPGALVEFLRGRQPSLVNRYGRHYFLSRDGLFRLTVDTHIQFFSPCETAPCRAPMRPVPIVIELKFAPEHADAAARVTNILPFRLARCSKYILGIQAIGFVSSGRPFRFAPSASPEPLALVPEPAPAGAAL